jgi:hypothetical protein
MRRPGITELALGGMLLFTGTLEAQEILGAGHDLPSDLDRGVTVGGVEMDLPHLASYHRFESTDGSGFQLFEPERDAPDFPNFALQDVPGVCYGYTRFMARWFREVIRPVLYYGMDVARTMSDIPDNLVAEGIVPPDPTVDDLGLRYLGENGLRNSIKGEALRRQLQWSPLIEDYRQNRGERGYDSGAALAQRWIDEIQRHGTSALGFNHTFRNAIGRSGGHAVLIAGYEYGRAVSTEFGSQPAIRFQIVDPNFVANMDGGQGTLAPERSYILYLVDSDRLTFGGEYAESYRRAGWILQGDWYLVEGQYEHVDVHSGPDLLPWWMTEGAAE